MKTYARPSEREEREDYPSRRLRQVRGVSHLLHGSAAAELLSGAVSADRRVREEARRAIREARRVADPGFVRLIELLCLVIPDAPPGSATTRGPTCPTGSRHTSAPSTCVG
jgi:hypothetical protein